MTVMVKICGMTPADDVGAALEAGADALGFIFAESPRRVTPAQAAKLARDIPDTVLRVAVMLHPANEEWRAVLDAFRPDVLQTDAADYATLDVPQSLHCWPVYRQGVSEPGDAPGDFVYEGAKSGKGDVVDWTRAADVARTGHMILAGGLGPANVAEAITRVVPWGVDASSSLERQPGRKDPLAMAAFVSAAKAAERDA